MKKIFLALFVMVFIQSLNAADEIRNVYATDRDAGTINKLVAAISSQLTQNKNFDNIQDPTIAITSFVCLDNFQPTTRLSNILSEGLLHEMQVRGYKIIDFKTMDNIKIDSKGDFLFSRNISKLRKTLNIDYALTGTYVKYRSGTVVNARIIDLKTHVILSSAQIFVPKQVMKHIAYSKKRHIPNFVQNKISLSQ
jgi:TolB-like protein